MTALAATFALAYAERFIGTAYHFGTAPGGGDDPVAGYDCSGLVTEVLRATGDLAYGERLNAQGLHDRFKKKSVRPVGAILPGDLLFFGKGLTGIYHVAIAHGSGRMIEAGGGDSATTNDAQAAARNAFVRIRPIAMHRDLVAVVRIWEEE